MTEHRSFKRLVRARMDKTGEAYTAARAALLQGPEEASPTARGAVRLPTTDARMRERTGRGWEAWCDLLDDWGATARPRPEVSRHVAGLLDLDPLAWDVQAVVAGYELARGLREPGQQGDGFRVTASRTIAAPAAAVFAAWVDPQRRAAWLGDLDLRERRATPPRRAGFDVGDGPTRVHLVVDVRPDGRSVVSVEHARLADAAEREDRGRFWRVRLDALKALLEVRDDA
jgi:uncharacterized protein YndB with AHSA1/START domain